MNRREFLTRIPIAAAAVPTGDALAMLIPNATDLAGNLSGETVLSDVDLAESAHAAGLVPDFTFDRFIEGRANQHARALAFVCPINPYSRRHPLCIYGAIGLGKTHLMQAIGHKVMAQDRGARVKYVHVEDFFDHMVRAFQTASLASFRECYASLEVLLLDDIQNLKRKHRTQHELLRILDKLAQRNRLIVMTGDRLPQYASEADGVDEMDNGLLSVIHGGQPVDLYNPDRELRTNCLMAWAEQDGLVLGNDVVRYVAKILSGDMRESKGALNRIVAYSRFHGKDISLPVAVEALRDIENSTRI